MVSEPEIVLSFDQPPEAAQLAAFPEADLTGTAPGSTVPGETELLIVKLTVGCGAATDTVAEASAVCEPDLTLTLPDFVPGVEYILLSGEPLPERPSSPDQE